MTIRLLSTVSLKSAMVRVFTLQKSVMLLNQVLIYCFVDYIDQELSNFFCKDPESKYFRLCYYFVTIASPLPFPSSPLSSPLSPPYYS